MSARYQRQEVLPGVGAAGTALLAAARVVVVGCGGLGSPAAVYLAGAGVGQLVLVDADRPELANLHRQPFYTEVDVNAGPGADERQGASAAKAQLLAAHCRRLNGDIAVEAIDEYLGPTNVHAILADATLVLECTDDVLTKYLVNDTCAARGIPLVYAAAQGFAGQLSVFANQAPDDVQLRDVFPEPDLGAVDCNTAGVLGTAVGTMALMQANAALCYLLGVGSPPVGELLQFDALGGGVFRMRLRKTYTAPAPGRVNQADLEREVDLAALPEGTLLLSILPPEEEPELLPGAQRVGDVTDLAAVAETIGEREAVVYCRSGRRSRAFVAGLRESGAGGRVYSMKGGRMGLAAGPHPRPA